MYMSNALIWGSDTGVTEEIVEVMKEHLDEFSFKIINVFEDEEIDYAVYDRIILGLSTWYDGELQSDWDEHFDRFKSVNFSDKKVAIFGLGDQEGYADYFIDGVGILADVVANNGGSIFGKWPVEGYTFSKSKALVDDKTFWGLAIDEDNQPELTDERIEHWISLLKNELFFE